MKKKTYKQPEMKVVELEQADIICTSGDFSTPTLYKDEEDFEF